MIYVYIVGSSMVKLINIPFTSYILKYVCVCVCVFRALKIYSRSKFPLYNTLLLDRSLGSCLTGSGVVGLRLGWSCSSGC
jgi:hypothetical protein